MAGEVTSNLHEILLSMTRPTCSTFDLVVPHQWEFEHCNINECTQGHQTVPVTRWKAHKSDCQFLANGKIGKNNNPQKFSPLYIPNYPYINNVICYSQLLIKGPWNLSHGSWKCLEFWNSGLCGSGNIIPCGMFINMNRHTSDEMSWVPPEYVLGYIGLELGCYVAYLSMYIIDWYRFVFVILDSPICGTSSSCSTTFEWNAEVCGLPFRHQRLQQQLGLAFSASTPTLSAQNETCFCLITYYSYFLGNIEYFVPKVDSELCSRNYNSSQGPSSFYS